MILSGFIKSYIAEPCLENSGFEDFIIFSISSFIFLFVPTGTVYLTARMKNLFPRVSDILEIDSVEVIIWLKSHSPFFGFSGVFTQRKIFSEPYNTTFKSSIKVIDFFS